MINQILSYTFVPQINPAAKLKKTFSALRELFTSEAATRGVL